MLLFYIVIGVASMVLFRQATSGAEGTVATLASISQHVTTVRLTVVLGLLTFMAAVTLAVHEKQKGNTRTDVQTFEFTIIDALR